MSGSPDETGGRLFHIKDRKSCINALNRVKGVFLVNDLDFVLTEPEPQWLELKDPDDPESELKAESKEFKENSKKWKTADRKCRGYYLQYLLEDDADAAEDLTAAEIDRYLRDKYCADKEQSGLHSAIHTMRSINIVESDTYAQALVKINNMTTQANVANRVLCGDYAVVNFSEIAQVAMVLECLPPSCSMLKQSWLEKPISSREYSLIRLKSSVQTFYETMRPTAQALSRARGPNRPLSAQSAPLSQSTTGPVSEQVRLYGPFCKACNKRHFRDSTDCVLKKTDWSSQNKRIDALSKQMEQTILLLKANPAATPPAPAEEPKIYELLTTSIGSCLLTQPTLPYTHTLDSAAVRTFYHVKDFFVTLSKLPQPFPLGAAWSTSGKPAMAIAKGSIRIPAGSSYILIPDAFYAPDIQYNLISESQLDKLGYKLARGNQETIVSKDSDTLLRFALQANDFYQKVISPVPSINQMSNALPTVRPRKPATEEEYLTWHARLGCLGLQSLVEASRDNPELPYFQSSLTVPFCDICAQAKSKRVPANRSAIPTLISTSQVLQIIHTDVCGPFPESVGGSTMFITFTDDYSGYTVVFTMKRKSEAGDIIQKYMAAAERYTGKKIISFKLDNGGEYGGVFAKICSQAGIALNPAPAYHPSLNGVAERVNLTLADKYLALLTRAGLPDRFWAEALQEAVRLKNRSPTARLPKGVTPYERWMGKKPDLSKARVFGCVAWVHVDKHARLNKLDTKALKCLNLGYWEEYGQWRLFEPHTKRILLSRDARFNEESFFKFDDDMRQAEYRRNVPISMSALDKSQKAQQGNSAGLRAFLSKTIHPDIQSLDLEQAHTLIGGGNLVLLTDSNVLQAATTYKRDPNSYAEAMADPDADLWKDAIQKELDSMLAMGVFKIVDLPPGKKTLGCRYTFERKRNANGEITRHKARLVVQGFSQQPGVDYD